MNSAQLNILLFSGGFIFPYLLGLIIMLVYGINISPKYLYVGLLSLSLFFLLQAFLPSWTIVVPTYKDATRNIILLLCATAYSGFYFNFQNINGNILDIAKAGDREYELAFMQGSLTNLLYFINQIIAPIMLICFLITRRKIFFMLLVVTFLILLFHGTRSSLIYPFSSCIVIYIIMHGFVFFKTKKFFFIVALLLFTFQSITVLRNIVEILDGNYSLFQILTHRNEDILFYLAGGFINLNEELKVLRSFSSGVEQYGFFIRPFQSFFEVNVDVQQSYYLWNKAFNVGTALRASWRDFGFIGVIFVILLHGLILMMAAALHHHFKSIFSITIYAICGNFLLFMFFSDQFLKPVNMYFIVILLACCVVERLVWKSTRKGNNKKLI